MATTATATPNPDNAAVTLDVTWTGADEVKIERKVEGGKYVPIRSGLEIPLDAGDHVIVDDYEAEMDVALTYRVTQSVPAPGAGVNPIIITGVILPSQGWSWLKDPALPSRNLRLDEVQNIETEIFASRAGVFDVVDRARPVVVAALRRDRVSELIVTTQTESQRGRMEKLLSSGQILLLTTPAAYAWGNDYVHVGDVSEARIGLADEPSRRWTLPITVVDRPASLAYAPATMTWGDVVAEWVTWADLLEDVLTWDDLINTAPE